MKRIRRSLAVIPLLFTIVGYLSSQEAADTAEPTAALAADMQRRVMLAESEPGYPITPGDVFRLSYVSSLGTQSATVTVESNYTLNMGIFGNIDTRNQGLAELRRRMETSVTRAYPGSYPTVVLTRTGSFKVFVRGEVSASYHAQAW